MPQTYWFAAILVATSILTWLFASGTRALTRLLLRLAAVFSLVLAVTAPFPRLQPLTLMAPTLALPALALATHTAFRRPPSRPVLLTVFILSAALALIAAIWSLPGLILPPQLAAIVISLGVARKGCLRLSAPSLMLATGALAMFAALAALLSDEADGTAGALIFSAVGLMGMSLAVTRISDTFVPDGRAPYY